MTAGLRAAIVVRPAQGGIRRHVSLLLGGLAARGVAPILYAPADFAPDPDFGIPRVAITIGARTRPFADAAAMRLLAESLPNETDLVHAHGLRAALIAAGAAARRRIPFLFTAHNIVPPDGLLAGIALRYISSRARSIIAVSGAVSESLMARGVSAEKIEVVPNGIDLAPYAAELDAAAVRSQYGIPNGAIIVAAVGRLASEKGFDILIRAMAAVTDSFPNAYLIIAGDGPERHALAAAARGLNVAFPGVVSDVASLLRVADVAVAPSRSEGQGIVAIEAMAAGVAIVASRVGGLPETVPDGVAGVLTPPEDPPALAQAIVALLHDPARRAAMGAAGRKVAAGYSAGSMCARMIEIYERIAASPKDQGARHL